MFTENLRIVHLLLVVILASQGIFYLLGAAEAFREISISSFAEQRKAVDMVIAGRLKVLYLSALIVGILLLVVLRKAPLSLPFICTAAATILLLIDLIIAIKVNIPINEAFLSYTKSSNTDFKVLQHDWLKAVVIRSICSAAALASLLISLIYPLRG